MSNKKKCLIKSIIDKRNARRAGRSDIDVLGHSAKRLVGSILVVTALRAAATCILIKAGLDTAGSVYRVIKREGQEDGRE